VVAAGLICSVLAAPFNDALSEAIERREMGRAAAPQGWSALVRELGRSLCLALVKLGAFVGVMTPLSIFSAFVPGVGPLLSTVVGSVFTAAYLALDYADWPASRRGLDVRARIAFLWHRPLLMLGFGTAVWLCLFVPILNVAFMPIAVAGGTRLFLDLEAAQHS
jgi:CysZ protein